MINLTLGTLAFVSAVTGFGVDFAFGVAGGYLFGRGLFEIVNERSSSDRQRY